MTVPVNNQNVKTTVENFIKSGRFPHAILIEGEVAESTCALADFLAAAAVCGETPSPCNNCRDCHLAKIKSHPDITYVQALDGKKNLSVEQIRQVRSDAYVKPHSANRRVFVIGDANRMNEQAQNALLKVLEEPPVNVVFILVTPSKTLLLDTIISRCVCLSLFGCSNTQSENSYQAEAERFAEALISGNEYAMLKILLPFEKDRLAAESFFGALSLECVKRIQSGGIYSRAFDCLYDDVKYYIQLLKTNINMPLLSSTVASRAKALSEI